MRITQKRRRDHPLSRSPSVSTSKTGSRAVWMVSGSSDRFITVTEKLRLGSNFSVDGLRRPLSPCRRVPIGLLLLPEWAATDADACMPDRYKVTGQPDDEILHELVLVVLAHFTIDVTLLQAAARACECGFRTKPLKSLLAGRSNRSPDSRACLWSSRASRHGDFLAARRLCRHGS